MKKLEYTPFQEHYVLCRLGEGVGIFDRCLPAQPCIEWRRSEAAARALWSRMTLAMRKAGKCPHCGQVSKIAATE